MNIETLIKKVEREAKPDQFDETWVSFSREDASDSYSSLRRSTRDELEKMRAQLNRLIPNDFDYHVFIEDGSISGSLEYSDGPDSGGGMGLPAELDGNYVQDLKKVNWEDLRAFFIQGANLHDNAAAIAKNLPSKMPSTAAAQLFHAEALESFMSEIKNDNAILGVLAYDDTADSYIASAYAENERETMDADICDMLTFGFPIIAIVENGELLRVDATEKLKHELVDRLEPVSRAKALGQFEQAMNMTMS
ncbi:hypothetical protein JIN77_09215 [Verrucomicrobiaceae bacterium R5-34]|nr:hypothetical protein [Verrucomicrobiaceae bacterium R5-34]